MDTLLQKSAQVFRKPGPLLVVVLAITALFAFGIPHLKIDNDVKSMLPPNERTRMITELYDSEANFGSTNAVLVAFQSKDIFGLDTLVYIKKVGDEIEALNRSIPVRQLALVLGLTGDQATKVLDDLHTVGINDLNYRDELVALVRSSEKTQKRFGWDKTLADKVAAASAIVTPEKLFAVYSPPLGTLQSLVTSDYIASEDDAMVAKKLIEDENPTAESIAGLKERVASWDTFEGTLVSKDLTMTTLTVMLKSEDKDVKAMFNADLTKIIASPPAGILVAEAGEPVVLDHLSQAMTQDMPVLIPIMLLVLVLILFFCFRTAQGVVFPLLLTILAIIWSFGLMGFLGVPLTAIGSMIPILLIAIVSAYGIHQLNHFYEDPQPDKFVALHHNARSVGLAILLSGLTVMIGFGSMVMLDFQPIRNFGVFTAFGDLIGVLAALYVLPALLMVGKPQKKVRTVVSEDEKHDVIAHLLHGLKALGRRHPGRVLVLVGLGTFLVGGGALLVKSDLDELSFFQPHDTIRVADRLMNEKMAGTKSLEVILDSDTRDPLSRQGNPDQIVSLATPAVLKKLDQFSVDLRAKFPQVRKVNSYSDVLKKMNQVMNGGGAGFYAIPDDEALVAQYLEIFSGDTKALMTSNRDKLRIMVSMNSGTQDAIHQIALYAESYFDKAFRDQNHVQVQVAGAQAITYVANQTLNKGNLESITACLIIVFVLLVVVLRNVRMTLISVIPIVLCLAVNFGYMGYTGMPLNTATSLVSSIGIGIGIDFLIHFITWYRRELLVDRNILAAVDRTILHKGRAILYNLFVIVGGFLVLVGSSMGPMRDFGLLTALCLTVTAAGSLVVVPAVIRVLAWGNHKFLYLGVTEIVPRAMETE